MTGYFFDTSALAKRYCEEPGTETVDRLIESETSRIVISTLTVIETTSAIKRHVNRGRIGEDDADDLLTHFYREALESYELVSLSEPSLTRSFELILEDDLRTLDSLQLSTALTVDESADLTFVCADDALLAVAAERGLATMNPINEV